jgi:hypothetical protein
VQVEGVAEDRKVAATVLCGFYEFYLVGIDHWPDGVRGRRVVVTGALTLLPAFTEEEYEKLMSSGPVQTEGPHPEAYAIKETHWELKPGDGLLPSAPRPDRALPV